ncbi:MAG: stage II sporulation protein E, partial [Thermoactinomyces sp.]
MRNFLFRPVSNWFGLEKGRQKRIMYRVAKTWNIPIIMMGVLLGRATILDTVSPFALAYLAVIYHIARKQWPVVMLSLIAGAATISSFEMAKMTGSLMIYLLIQKGFDVLGKGQISYSPFAVGFCSIVVHLAEWWWGDWNPYQLLLAGVEMLLSFILTFIFVQSLPVFTVKKKRISLRQEEIVCLVILMGSVMSGMMGWQAGELTIVNIISRYAVLTLALVGGEMLGSSMGVVTGII